jgi:hypothetical protein
LAGLFGRPDPAAGRSVVSLGVFLPLTNAVGGVLLRLAPRHVACLEFDFLVLPRRPPNLTLPSSGLQTR